MEQNSGRRALDENKERAEQDEKKSVSLDDGNLPQQPADDALQLQQQQQRQPRPQRRRAAIQAVRSSGRYRGPIARSWSAMVAYTGPAGRKTVFHKATCKFVEALSGRDWKFCTRVQANGFGMRPAAGCQFNCIADAQD